MAPRVSIVVPVLDEVAALPRLLDSLATRDDDVEVVVADGGSRDGTLELARARADLVVQTEPGRASQMNAGAAAARGLILWFVHADTLLPPSALTAVRAAVEQGAVGGGFRLRIDAPQRALRWIERGVAWRSRWLRLPYGDQALFVRRDVFDALGGFRPLPIMEDVDFVRRLRRRGPLVLLAPPVTTSARRWLAHGILRTTTANVTAALLFHAAVSPKLIRRCYATMLRSSRTTR